MKKCGRLINVLRWEKFESDASDDDIGGFGSDAYDDEREEKKISNSITSVYILYTPSSNHHNNSNRNSMLRMQTFLFSHTHVSSGPRSGRRSSKKAWVLHQHAALDSGIRYQHLQAQQRPMILLNPLYHQ